MLIEVLYWKEIEIKLLYKPKQFTTLLPVSDVKQWP